MVGGEGAKLRAILRNFEGGIGQENIINETRKELDLYEPTPPMPRPGGLWYDTCRDCGHSARRGGLRGRS